MSCTYFADSVYVTNTERMTQLKEKYIKSDSVVCPTL